MTEREYWKSWNLAEMKTPTACQLINNWSSEIWHMPKIQFDFLKKKKKKKFNLINTVYAVVYVILWQTKDNTQ